MRLLIILMVSLSILVIIVHFIDASEIKIQVSEKISSDFKTTAVEEDRNIITAYLGVHNTGSIEYDARARMDIMSGDQILFTGWSKVIKINPGQRTGFVIYGYKPDATNLSLRMRLYHGNEIKELEPLGISDRNMTFDVVNPFKIMNFRVYDDNIRFEVTSNHSLSDVLIIPKAYSGSWVFEQRRIEAIGEGEIKEIILPYHTGFFRERNVTIAIASADGKYYNEHEFRLRREAGLLKYINLFMDWVGGFFRS